MKREMDLVRNILLQIEANSKPHLTKVEIEGQAEDLIGYHLDLLEQAGFVVDANTTLRFHGRPLARRVRHGFTLTWDGHEFLDTVRDPEIWQKTKSGARQVGSWSITLLAEFAKSLAMQKARDLGLLP